MEYSIHALLPVRFILRQPVPKRLTRSCYLSDALLREGALFDLSTLTTGPTLKVQTGS